MTALHFAAIEGSASTCRLLIDEGASLTAVDDKGRTLLKEAKSRGNAECVAILEAPTAAAEVAVKESAEAAAATAKEAAEAACQLVMDALQVHA